MLDDDECAPAAPPGGSAGAGAAETSVLEDGERAPFCSSTEAGAATMGVREDGERSAMSGELVAKRKSKLNQVTGTVGSSVASWASGVETRRWRAGTAAREDIVAGVMIRPPLSCAKQSAASGTMPAPGSQGHEPFKKVSYEALVFSVFSRNQE